MWLGPATKHTGVGTLQVLMAEKRASDSLYGGHYAQYTEVDELSNAHVVMCVDRIRPLWANHVRDQGQPCLGVQTARKY
jgi:hypothetical protein